MKDIFYKYDCINAFLKDIDNAKTSRVFVTKDVSRNENSSYNDFCGTESYQAASNLLRHGDDTNAKKINAGLTKVKAHTANAGTRPQMYTSQAGFLPCVPKAIAGIPTNMYNRKLVAFKNSKVLTIIYSNTALCDVSADEICAVSVNLVNAIMSAEKSGYRVNLYILYESRKHSERLVGLVKIKDSGAYLDKKKLAYPLVNPSMLRRHFFRFLETRPELSDKKWPDGYGTNFSDEDTEKILKDNNFKYDYYFSFYSVRNLSSEEICKKFTEK